MASRHPQIDRSQNRIAKDRVHVVLRGIAAECRAIASRFGFQHFHFGLRVTLRPGAPIQAFVDGGPNGCAAIYDVLASLAEDEPTAKAIHAMTPFDWREAMIATGKPGQALLNESIAAGMSYGIAIPLHGPWMAHGLLVLGSTMPLPWSNHLRNILFRESHWAAVHMFEGALGEMQRAWGESPRRALTSRQRKALSLLAGGQGLVGVAQHLHVHSSTARYLVTRAIEKIGAQTREEALVRFAAAGELHHRLYPRSVKDSHFHVPDAASGVKAS